MAVSPTQRALAFCKREGWTAQIVERWNQWAKVRQDLFGFADLVVLAEGQPITAVQVTSGAHMANRMTKIEQEPRAMLWLRAGGAIQTWGTKKLGARGKRKLWTIDRMFAYVDGAGAIQWGDV